MNTKQIKLKFGPHNYELNIPVDTTANNAEMGRSFVLAGIALIGFDSIAEYVENLKYAPEQTQFAWMAENECSAGRR
jgi:hypothetical protein